MVSRSANRGIYGARMMLSRLRALPLVVAGVFTGICTRVQAPARKCQGRPALSIIGEADLHDDTCHDSWVLKHINHTMRQVVEERNAEWYDSLPKILENAYDKNTLTRSGDGGDPIEPRAWNHVMMPPIEGACQMEKIGLKDLDGGKLVCGIQDIPDNEERPCIIYSIDCLERLEMIC